MTAVVWTDVTSHAPALASVVSGAQTDILAYVNAVIDPSILDGEAGARTKLARIYLAAHLGTVGKRGSAGGPLTSESAGGISRGYGALMTGALLDETGFGRSYREIVRTSRARGPRVL